jgi:hypothetical protein
MEKIKTETSNNYAKKQQTTTVIAEMLDLSMLVDYVKRNKLSETGNYWSVLSEMQQTTF